MSEDCVLNISRNGRYLHWNFLINLNGTERISFSRRFVMKISPDGMLEHVSDMWGTAYIGSTNVKVSREEAISIALSHAEKYARNYNRTVSKVIDASLQFERDKFLFFKNSTVTVSSRGDDWAMYPYWRVEMRFNEPIGIPGQTSLQLDYIVYIWTDNGEIANEDIQGTYRPSYPEDDSGAPEQITPKPENRMYWLITIIPTLSALLIAQAMYRWWRKTKHRKPSSLRSSPPLFYRV